jgi:hypothetical protein
MYRVMILRNSQQRTSFFVVGGKMELLPRPASILGAGMSLVREYCLTPLRLPERLLHMSSRRKQVLTPSCCGKATGPSPEALMAPQYD